MSTELARELTRRQLLSYSIQASASLMALPLATADPAKRVSKMRFGLMTYQWGADWDIPTTIANCTSELTATTVAVRFI